MAYIPHTMMADRNGRAQRRHLLPGLVTMLMLVTLAGLPFDPTTTAAPQSVQPATSARGQSGSVPGTPNLVSPPTGTTYGTTPKSVTLTWQAVSGATSYQVVINDGSMQSPWVSGTSWTTGQLGNGQYAWQVRARNGNGTGKLSPKWVFWVDPSSGDPDPSPSPGPSGPTLARSPYQGKVGTLVSVTASDFGANETVKLYWGDTSSGPSLGQLQTNGSGTGSTTITIPQDSPGWHDYTGIGQTSKKQAWGAIQILGDDPPPPSGGGGGSSMIGPGTYAVTATEEGLVGDTTSNGHLIQPMDNFVSLPACTTSSCPWLGSSAPANCGSDCFVRVTNPNTGQCAVAPVYDVGPWFTNDDYWNPTASRILNNLATTVNILPQGYTGADAARDGLDVGYGRAADGIGISNVSYEVGNRAAIDLADGTWTKIGYEIGDGIGPATVTMLWQTGEDPSSAASACGQTGTSPSPSPSPPPGSDGNTVVTTDNLNLRTGPGTTFPVITVMPAGSVVTLTGQSQNGFLSVEYQNTSGWASAQYLSVNGSPPPSPSPSASPSPSPDPAVTVTPKSGAPGTAISLTATGFAPGETVAQYWDDSVLAGAWGTADSSGKAIINRKVPNVAAGGVTLRVKGRTSGKTASISFTVMAPSPSPSPSSTTSVSVSPTSGAPGTAISLSAKGFAPGERLAQYWGDANLAGAWGNADSSGNGVINRKVPNVPTGPVTLHVKGVSSGRTASVGFTVTNASPSPSPSPAVTVSPTSGSIGTAMTLTSTGFAPGETVAQYWGDSALAGAWGTADSSGQAIINRTVPNVENGSVTLHVKGRTSGRTAITSFTVTSASPSPSPGANTATTTDNLNLRTGPGLSYSVIVVMPVGSTVTLTGQNQNGYLAVHYQSYDGWASADYLDVTSSPPSSNPAVTVSPTSGTPGTAISLSATGFAPGERLSQYWGDSRLAGAWGNADSSGNGVINRSVPNVPAGPVTLHVRGATSGRTASVPFTVNAAGAFQAQRQASVAPPAASPSPSASPSSSPTASPSPSPSASPTPSSSSAGGTPAAVGTPSAAPPESTAAGPPTPEATGESASVTAASAEEATAPLPAETPTPESAPAVEATSSAAPTVAPTPPEEATVEPAPTEVPTTEPAPEEEATAAPPPEEEATEAPAPTEEPQSQELDFSTVANASVSAADPDSVLPSDVLTAGGPDGDIAFVTFQVEGIGAGTVVSAQLVLNGAGDSAGDGGTLGVLPGVAVDEGSVTYNTAPALDAPAAISADGSAVGVGWLEPGGQVVLDVTGSVTADGTITFVIPGTPDAAVGIAGGSSTLIVTVAS